MTCRSLPCEDRKTAHWKRTATFREGRSFRSGSPEWSVATFTGLDKGLYIVLLRGPQPLQRLSAKANVGAAGVTLRFAIPKTETSLRITLPRKAFAGGGVELTHDELRWSTKLETGGDGRCAGALWEPGLYTASVRRNSSVPHQVDVMLSPQALTIDVPDRTVTGRVIGDDGEPIANALVALKSENEISALTLRTTSGADGRFEFFGMREGAHSLSARASSYVNSDAVSFELHGAPAHRNVELTLAHGARRTVRVVDERGHPIAAPRCSPPATDTSNRQRTRMPKDARTWRCRSPARAGSMRCRRKGRSR
jgi:hypothetical protein